MLTIYAKSFMTATRAAGQAPRRSHMSDPLPRLRAPRPAAPRKED